MAPTPEEFRAAIASYAFPAVEEITYESLVKTPVQNVYPSNPSLFVFRRTPGASHSEDKLPLFWASALFNFLEDCGDDNVFGAVGARGSFRQVDGLEASPAIAALLAGAESEEVTIPKEPRHCFVTLDYPDFQALAGIDGHGLFAVIWRRWPSAQS